MSRAPVRVPPSGEKASAAATPEQKASAGPRAYLRRGRRESHGAGAPAPQARTLTRPLTAVRAALGRVPAAAWTCALIALLNAGAWSIITPPFQGKDEIDHFSYVVRLAEAHALPEKRGGEEPYPPGELHVTEALDSAEVQREYLAAGALDSLDELCLDAEGANEPIEVGRDHHLRPAALDRLDGAQ